MGVIQFRNSKNKFIIIEIFSTERLRKLYSRVKEFVENELYPLEISLLNQTSDKTIAVLDKLREKAKENGLWTPYLKKEEGGQGLTILEFVQISEILGTSPFGHYVLSCQAPDIGNIELLTYASPELKERYLAPLIRSEIRSCFSRIVKRIY